MYEWGGRLNVRSQCEVHDDGDGKRIVITEILYQVKKMNVEGIADLVSKEQSRASATFVMNPAKKESV